MSKPLSVLQNIFGYADFRFNQKEIIEDLIAGQDSFVLMPTGGGKSLCYQIPAMVRDGVALDFFDERSSGCFECQWCASRLL